MQSVYYLFVSFESFLSSIMSCSTVDANSVACTELFDTIPTLVAEALSSVSQRPLPTNDICMYDMPPNATGGSEKGSSHLISSGIVGGVVASIAFVMIICVGAVIWKVRRKQKEALGKCDGEHRAASLPTVH